MRAGREINDGVPWVMGLLLHMLHVGVFLRGEGPARRAPAIRVLGRRRGCCSGGGSGGYALAPLDHGLLHRVRAMCPVQLVVKAYVIPGQFQDVDVRDGAIADG